MDQDEPSLAELADSLSISASTLRRWVAEDIVPLRDGEWTPAAVAQARLVARLRARGHSLETVRRAAPGGPLAHGHLQDPFPPGGAPPRGRGAGRGTGAPAPRLRPPPAGGR